MVLVIDGVVMKVKNLFKKNMLLILIPLIIISFTVVGISKNVIETYFRNDSFKILNRELELYNNSVEKALTTKEKIQSPDLVKPSPKQDLETVFKPNKSVQSVYLFETNNGKFKFFHDDETAVSLELEGLIGNTVWPLQGESNFGSEKIFYAIVPVKNLTMIEKYRVPKDAKLYLLSYISESYSLELTQSIMTIFIVGLSVLIGLTIVILFFVFRKISLRLKELEEGTSKVGRGQFDTKISIEPYDEIGRLGEAMNRMSKQLHLIQEEQAENFQIIGHELKTPIMVMQGYLDAMAHEQYPSGSKEETIRILIQELGRLENLTKDILIISKVDYLSRNNVQMKTLHLSEHFRSVSNLLNLEDQIEITVSGEHTIVGDEESWHRIIENIISNNLRYAKSKITISLGPDIIIKNDGPPIESHLLNKIKSPFVKGNKGRSGLGLTIVSNTLKLYHYQLELRNTTDGVEYSIKKETD